MPGESIDGHRLESVFEESDLLRDHLAAVREAGGERILRLRRILLPEAPSEEALALFRGELEALQASPHEGLLVPLSSGLHHELPYLLTEVPPGASLRAVLDRGALEVPLALRLGLDLAQSLTHLHGAASPLLHRALSPWHVRLDQGGCALLDGLPIGALLHGVSAQSQGHMDAACAYLAPEQIKGGALSGKSDVFSLGSLLYEAIAGEKAFVASTSVGVMIQISTGRHKPLAPKDSGGKERPAALLELLKRMLALDPAWRPSAEEVVEALAALVPEGREPRAALAARAREAVGKNDAAHQEQLDERATIPATLSPALIAEARRALRGGGAGTASGEIARQPSIDIVGSLDRDTAPEVRVAAEEDLVATHRISTMSAQQLAEARALNDHQREPEREPEPEEAASGMDATKPFRLPEDEEDSAATREHRLPALDDGGEEDPLATAEALAPLAAAPDLPAAAPAQAAASPAAPASSGSPTMWIAGAALALFALVLLGLLLYAATR